ncbi:TerC family protein [Phytoactinopolyspora mesophila]|uniref:TerC/Alx family metal homeostasis membrane protein n=1 Tax=Phytoactinopolyspora mesophila TaxID=2650750 RepID=A0A7K3LWX3_9ACTN|nr:TerC family protein [Phytoactinopolyspora mesophila]NDL55503.1 TerC/Alx family metal homeostasis membrane protein [Phytoactinopolyspora mesophila]
MLDLPVWFEIGTLVVITLLLIADLLIVTRRPHAPSMRESSAWVTFYIALPILFGFLLLFVSGGQASGEFFAGWLTEKSLSVDNLFIFVIIMTQFRVPRQYQQSVLMFGILLAIVMRGAFIVLGAMAINQFAWVFYLFGAFLIYTAVKLAQQQAATEVHDDSYDNALLRKISARLPVTDEYDSIKFRTRVDGRKMFTPMLVVFVAIASADLLFAVDSIPAIFGITQEMFIVFTANVFALMGLRQLYFLLGGLLERLVYLAAGLAVILAFIGVKLVLHALHENNLPFVNDGQPLHVPEIPIVASLVFIMATLAVTTVASLLKTRRDRRGELELDAVD